MELEECKISVWVCREEKLVSGLSRRTTCADVVKVLLEDQNLKQGVSAAMLSGSPQSYCIVEKWRGFERILPNKTKILRLWSAWGDEQENVRFVLVKNEASLPNNGPRSAEARVVLSKESPCMYKGTARATMAFSQEKQRRIVRKAFRKLDKINKKREEALTKDTSSVEKMETLVHLVISQDHTIRQQIQRIKELDREIDRYEAKVHFDRMKRHGINYVQDTYLVEGNPEADSKSDSDKPHTAETLARFEEYASRCEEVIKLQEELAEHQALMDSITVEIQEELNQRWMKRRQEELSNADKESNAEETVIRVTTAPLVTETDTATTELDISSENELLLEEERIKTQLDTSLYIGLRLNTDLEAIRVDLDMSQELWDVKEKELRNLLEKVDSLDIEEEIKPSADDKESSSVETEREMLPSLETNSGWVEQARGLSKKCNTNDEDSDTGLSSMHSQDSDNAAVCESLENLFELGFHGAH
ncbi:ras association domain-containing protein 10-like isoform X1 [Megalops cyprinoides]|uniref:ras association domain-containing protein 10-like isoform X1 n=1 Tax=Megalops cyprinoides TaxID=118141 RepID=UPI001864242A|nr:ras association domain-containing protein 10-like isoform X1 [Megalops cyprinoides]